MKISFNPQNSNKNILDLIKNNKDIIFDLKGHSIFARGVEFKGTDTNTWRPVVDNLTSDSTTSSLSAKQGKVLKALIDGKSNSDHNHDGRYLKLTGGTMASNALITFADSGSWNTSKKPQGARGGLYWTGQSDYAKLYAEETVEDNLDLVIQFGDDDSNGLSIRNKANTQTSYISSSGVITTGTFKGNLDWSYITNKPATATRWPSWAEVTGKPSSFTPSTHTHGLSNSVFFLNMPSINGNAKWKEVFGYPVNYNLLLSVRINNPAPEWCVGNFGSGILYGGSDTKGFMSSAYNEPFIMWAGGNGSSDDSVPKWYIGIKGTHKSIYNLATIASEANAAYNLRHSHANKSVLDGITSALVNSWNTAYNFVSNITGTDTDKVINKWEEIVNFLAGITEDNKLNTLLNSKLSVYELADNTNVGTIKNNGIYYSTTDTSSRTLINSPFNTGFAFINMTSYDGGDDLRRSRLAFNAFGEIKVSDDRDQANTAETWYNVLTSKNSGINGSTIKLNGTSITVYSSGTADGRYVKKSGDTMSGVLTIDTPNFGALTIKRNDDANGASIQFRGKSSVYGYIGLNNSTKDKQFLRWSSDTSRIYTILDTSSTYISNGKGVINGTTITQVDNATKLQTARSIWGQSFDGTGNVRGSLSEVGNIHFKVDNSYDIGSDAAASRYIYTHWLGARSGRKLELGANDSGFGQGLCIDTNLNVGIGTNIPAYKLDVKGDIYSSGYVRASSGFIKGSSSNSYVLLGGGGHKLESSLNVAYSKYLTGITLTGGDSNNAGYRLIFEKTMGGWNINYGVWAIAFRHSGRGTLNIGFDTTNPDGSTYTYNIRFLGSTVSRESTPFRAFYNSTTKVFRIYWHYYDYTSGDIAVLRGNMEPHNGTWMASLPNDVGTELAITCNMADQAANADTVDGYHANGLLTALSNSNNGISITVGGTTKSVSNISVNYASSAGNANTLDGYPANGSNNRPYGHIPTIGSDGVMEVGRYIDFHNDNNGKHDFSTRLQSTGNYGNEVNLPSASGTLALINDVNNYYWANVKISTSSSTTTSPTFSNVYLGNSLYLNTRGPNSIYNGPNDSANGVGGPLNNLVFSSWYGVSFTTSCAGSTYTNKNAVSINCRNGQLYARGVQANGFMHTGYNNNDAVLLAGGGYKTLKDFIFLNKSYNYTDSEHYNLNFHKLSGICNNLVWVDGHVKGSIAKNFVIDPAFFPYHYDNDPDLNTIYLMSGKNYITINAIGVVTINNATDHKQRVGFFYTGRA